MPVIKVRVHLHEIISVDTETDLLGIDDAEWEEMDEDERLELIEGHWDSEGSMPEFTIIE